MFERARLLRRIQHATAGVLLAAFLPESGADAQRTPPANPARAPETVRYPTTRTVSIVDNYFGTRVADPFRWLETDSPETRRWAAAQTAFAKPHLQNADYRRSIEAHIREYEKAFAALDSLDLAANREAPIRLEPTADGRREALVAQPDPQARPRVLLDPARFGALTRINRFRVARDEKHVIVELADGGSDWSVARIVRVADGVLLPDRVDNLLWSQPVWTRDSKGFFYVRQDRPKPNERVMYRNPAVYYHALGTPRNSDRLIFRTPEGTSDIVLNISVSGEGRYAIVSEGSGADSDEMGWVDSRLHVLDLGQPTAPTFDAKLVPLTGTRTNAYRVIRTNGSLLTVFTDHGAPRHRLVNIDLTNPAPDQWREVIPQSDDVLHEVQVISGRLVTVYMKDVQQFVRVFSMDGKLLREIRPPSMSRISVRAGAADSLLDVESESFLSGPRVVEYDLTTGASRTTFSIMSSFPSDSFVQSQRWYTSKDGTRVPMFLIHRKNLVLDGSNPTLLYGYGASSTSMLPAYSPDALTWLAMGGVYALPSLRGGGELGREWYNAATLEKKQNTFDDFIAAAEFLIAERYTSPKRLAIQGESNGGLLVAAVMTQRPELFAVAVPGVPQTDNLRYDRGRHRGQFGSAADSLQFRFLYAYSPYHHVQDKVCYPATLVTTALNDDRSPAWQAMKFAAALQKAQSCERPVVLRANVSGGHHGNQDTESLIRNASDVLTFVAAGVGLKIPPPPR